ncbi:polysaccharide deacetylase [Nitratireductor basaltis]|uniref:Polysaccharide deacetylase n=1 Tax=Nitratireductor basaltis TaxID=472175 RepID=A0A084UCX2_9HYPH|nr:polysaccharide deacetylase [Nitratireductor basaltis]KFB10808.1 Polysaccharide deacetylase [Nitratireductor basaltis]
MLQSPARTFRTILALLAGTAPLSAQEAQLEPGEPQYVIISFDGASHIEQWERSRALARETGASFTYFLSCVFVLNAEDRSRYQPPEMAAGRSNVGFAQSKAEVAARLDQIWNARAEGHEIASHGCGHFDGGGWGVQAWLQEFDQFETLMREAWTSNGLEGEPAGWASFVKDEIRGFRAPYLSTGPGLFTALAKSGFDYDASTVSNGPQMPGSRNGVVTFQLPMIPEGPKQKPVIAMDYNLYVRHSGGEEQPENASAYAERAYSAFKAAFDAQQSGDRIPLQIGYHFTLMNGGAYWDALERFARDVCVREDVRCLSYTDYLKVAPAEALDG